MSLFGWDIANITLSRPKPTLFRATVSLRALKTLFLTSALALGTFVPGSAFAQTDGLSNVTEASQSGTTKTTALPDELGFVGLSESLKGVSIELPDESLGSQLFKLDVTNPACLSGTESCFSSDYNQIDLDYATSLFKPDGKGLDIELMPRASVRFNDEASSALVGALVRIGDDLRKDSELKPNTWYMFAGADAEAVTYSPSGVGNITSGQFHLQDRIIVGDAQAGVGYRMGDADVSLGYFHREVTSFGREVDSQGLSFKEDAAALSFTWRR